MYYGCNKPVTVGKIITARLRSTSALEAVEEMLEKQRPAGLPARSRSFTVSVNPGDEKYVYEVEPIGNVAKTSPQYVQALQGFLVQRLHTRQGMTKNDWNKAYTLADAYWNDPNGTELLVVKLKVNSCIRSGRPVKKTQVRK